jgi:small subunit ribosomal protein S3
MGQKVHPKGYRLGITTEHRSRWYADSNKVGQRYQDYVREDVQIRRLLAKSLERAGIAKIHIERTTDKVRVDIFSARPGVVIGRKGGEAEKIRQQIGQLTKKQVQLNILEVRDAEADAQLVAQSVAEQLAARVTFRRAMKKGIQGALKSGGLGIKIQCSGRLGGAEMARQEFYREGSVPLHTLRAYVDYGFFEAHTTFGRIGVKVWIYKGETTEKEWNARAAQGGRNNDRRRQNRRNQERKEDTQVQNASESVPADAPVIEEPKAAAASNPVEDKKEKGGKE